MPDVVNTKVAFVILLATSGSRPPGTILIYMSRTQRAKVSKTISIPIGTYTHQ
jgi:hypothetical protein